MTIIDKLKYQKKPDILQRFLNSLFYDPDSFIAYKSLVKYLEIGDFKVLPTEHLDSFSLHEGWLEGARSTDIALDIGACIGGIAFPLSKLVKKVYAVEPLYTEELITNIELSGITNIEVIDRALYPITRETIELNFGSKRNKALTMDWEDLSKWVGEPIDFLKIDIEGGEWAILNLDFLRKIREIRIEFHILHKGRSNWLRKAYQWEKDLINLGYKTSTFEVKAISTTIERTIHLIASKT
jgi:FkbM family methyltransferase